MDGLLEEIRGLSYGVSFSRTYAGEIRRALAEGDLQKAVLHTRQGPNIVQAIACGCAGAFTAPEYQPPGRFDAWWDTLILRW